MPAKSIRQHEKMDVHYATIHEFFDAFSLPTARGYLLSAMKATEKNRTWNKAAPADLLYFFEKLDALLSGAFVISQSGLTRNKVLLPAANTPDIGLTALYCGSFHKYQPWDYFPRSLSVKEYNNPYTALQKCIGKSGKTQWKNILRDLLSYSLCSNTLLENGSDIKILQTTLCLQKILEACHLIHIRLNMQESSR